MSVTFFNAGLTVSDEAATRADAFCEAHMLRFYRQENGGEDPPGWPDPIGHKRLIEWSIKFLFSHRVRQWEREIAIQNLENPPPWEGSS
jgi:hypothetical protein